MKGLILLIISILPILLIGTYIYKKDREKEPISILIKLFFSGIISCFLVLTMTNILSVYMPFIKESININTPIELFLHAFIGISFIEEFCKWLMTYTISYNDKNFDETYDMIIYAVFVSLGFALFENIMYVFGRGMTIAIIRAIISVPAHTCNAVFMGYFLSKAKTCSVKDDNIGRQKNIIYSLLIPTLLHGTYDYCLFLKNDLFIVVFFIFVITLFIVTVKKINLQSKNNQKIEN